MAQHPLASRQGLNFYTTKSEREVAVPWFATTTYRSSQQNKEKEQEEDSAAKVEEAQRSAAKVEEPKKAAEVVGDDATSEEEEDDHFPVGEQEEAPVKRGSVIHSRRDAEARHRSPSWLPSSFFLQSTSKFQPGGRVSNS